MNGMACFPSSSIVKLACPGPLRIRWQGALPLSDGSWIPVESPDNGTLHQCRLFTMTDLPPDGCCHQGIIVI